MSTARFDLTIAREEKDAVSRAASLMGTTMAAFIRFAAMEKAREVIQKDSLVTLSERDFKAFVQALQAPPPFNAKLRGALNAAQKVRRA